VHLYQQDKTVKEIADDLSVGRATAHRLLKMASQWKKQLSNSST
jgi:DNA-binding transcriptional regulator LsrR (DeoR family)